MPLLHSVPNITMPARSQGRAAGSRAVTLTPINRPSAHRFRDVKSTQMEYSTTSASAPKRILELDFPCFQSLDLSESPEMPST
jgi:hypothetical protein